MPDNLTKSPFTLRLRSFKTRSVASHQRRNLAPEDARTMARAPAPGGMPRLCEIRANRHAVLGCGTGFAPLRARSTAPMSGALVEVFGRSAMSRPITEFRDSARLRRPTYSQETP